jgi:hypothetical protein
MTERGLYIICVSFTTVWTWKDLEHSESSNCHSRFAGRGPDVMLTVLDEWLALMNLGIAYK